MIIIGEFQNELDEAEAMMIDKVFTLMNRIRDCANHINDKTYQSALKI